MKRHMECLIAAALLSVSLASCASGGKASVTKAGESVMTTSEQNTVNTSYPAPDIPAYDGKGADFKIICYDPASDEGKFPYSEFGADEQNGETLNDAVYARNLKVEEKYNIKIVPVVMKNQGDGKTMIMKAVSAGDDVYKFASDQLIGDMTLAAGGYVAEFDDLPYFDLAAPWWLNSLNDSLTVGNKHYMLAGYLNFRLFDATGAMYFNKEIAEKFSVDPYPIIENGGWTVEKFLSLSQGITADIDGDGKMTEKDQYGYSANNSNWLQFFISNGCASVTKDGGDLPVYSLGTEKNIGVLEKIITFMNDAETTLLAERFTGWPYSGVENLRMWIPVNAMTQDRTLFMSDLVYNVRFLRDMETDFGIIPLPKYDESQTDYSVYIHQNHATATVIPIVNADMDFTCRVIGDLAYQSYKIIRPALFETILSVKYARDAESVKSLDIIFSNSRADLGVIMSLDIDSIMRTLVAKGDTGVSSALGSVADSNTAKVQEFIKNINERK